MNFEDIKLTLELINVVIDESCCEEVKRESIILLLTDIYEFMKIVVDNDHLEESPNDYYNHLRLLILFNKTLESEEKLKLLTLFRTISI